ncbi:MAG TPA: hypothetical protein VH163_10035 [Gemmatimonadales bacterium]|jgi:hypothetical protein|nr:hypothetical protein [Gemmatimonadales bacterium]
MFRALRGTAIWTVLLVVALASASQAQFRGLREVEPSAGPQAGLSLMFGVPQGEFRQFVKSVGGFDGFLTVPVTRSGLGVRLEGSMLFHGGNCYSGCALETTSYIGTLRAGPQVTLGTGNVRLYGLATAGFSYFSTDVNDRYGCGCYGSDGNTLLEDFTGSWEAGGGILMYLGRGGRVGLDLGARYQDNGRATYLNNSSVQANGDGTFTVTPIRTSVNLVLYHLGMSFTF